MTSTMGKYPPGRTVGAVYDNGPGDNPFLAAMPDLMGRERFLEQIKSMPPLPRQLSSMTSEQRRQTMPMLCSVYVPMDYMYAIYDQLYRAITTTYTTLAVKKSVTQSNALFRGTGAKTFATQADTGSILGVPGIGKTSTVRRCLSLMPQVIEHTEYQGQVLFCKQVLYLHIECPSDCSIKTLAFNLVAALDKAIGSRYLEDLTSLRSVAASALAAQVKILCMTHHVGLILVGEIQNAVMTARQNRQIKPLIKFLVELTNDTCTSIYFIGTPAAEELFTSQEHLKRRTRGIRLLPLRPDGVYRSFLSQLWRYQFTLRPAPLTDKLANKLYDFSGGIPAYIVRIFQESQVQALLQGRSQIDEKMMQRAIDILAIKVPKTYSGGTFLSDFSIAGEEGEEGEIKAAKEEAQEVKRLYANKRGRRAAQRDREDLLAAYEAREDILQQMTALGLVEGWPPC